MQRHRTDPMRLLPVRTTAAAIAATLFVVTLACGCADEAAPAGSVGHVGESTAAASRTRDGSTGAPSKIRSRSTSPSERRDPPGAAQAPVSREGTREAIGTAETGQDARDQPPESRVYRRSDERPVHDDVLLAASGILTFESNRLKLYTDIDPEVARTLPVVIDAAWDAWGEYFGPLPPDREGREYQITGYIMADQALFREAGLVPEHLPGFVNGRHWENRFWMHDRPSHYYRRHLMIHEATHCFMTAARDMRSLTPVWYFEGMAELFGTHRLHDDGRVEFRTLPRSLGEVADSGRNLGRIELVQQAVAEGRTRSVADVLAIEPRDYSDDEAYAWSWALCKLLDAHPRYRERFRGLSEYLSPRAFVRAFDEAFLSDAGGKDELETEWTLFIHNLQHGYDIERAAIDFRPGRELTGPDDLHRVEITADRGWQSSGVRVEAGRTYHVAAGGRFTLAETPRPWVCEPQGISFRYFGGQPLGRLLGAVRPHTPATGESMLVVTPLGREATFTSPTSGTLYLRLNDSWSELVDNSGRIDVTVQPDGTP